MKGKHGSSLSVWLSAHLREGLNWPILEANLSGSIVGYIKHQSLTWSGKLSQFWSSKTHHLYSDRSRDSKRQSPNTVQGACRRWLSVKVAPLKLIWCHHELENLSINVSDQTCRSISTTSKWIFLDVFGCFLMCFATLTCFWPMFYKQAASTLGSMKPLSMASVQHIRVKQSSLVKWQPFWASTSWSKLEAKLGASRVQTFVGFGMRCLSQTVEGHDSKMLGLKAISSTQSHDFKSSAKMQHTQKTWTWRVCFVLFCSNTKRKVFWDKHGIYLWPSTPQPTSFQNIKKCNKNQQNGPEAYRSRSDCRIADLAFSETFPRHG